MLLKFVSHALPAQACTCKAEALTSCSIATFYVYVAAGANLGLFSIFFAAQTGPKGMVYSFEPQMRMYQVSQLDGQPLPNDRSGGQGV
jgi:hypothetical protein